VVALRHVPESRDASASQRLDLPGALLAVAGLGTLTYGLIGAGKGVNPVVTTFVILGLVLLATFVVVERRSSHPLVPTGLFTNTTFTAINGVTFLVYGAFGVFFFLTVLELQVVAGFTPIAAGTSLLPVTALMLLLSARVGALADRIGARWPMTVGLLLAATGLALSTRIGPHASYLTDVLPAIALFGLGLSLIVAPLTATVLASASGGHAGIASGVNNAVARAAGLLAVAVIPVVAGLGGRNYASPAVLAGGYRTSVLICAGLLLFAAVLTVVLIRPVPAQAAEEAPPPCMHCGVTGPQVHPVAAGERAAT
jgi:hypothetical protein